MSKVKKEGNRVIMTAVEWDRIKLEMGDQKRLVAKLQEQLGEALNTCRDLAHSNTKEGERHDSLMKELRLELKEANDTIQSLQDKVVDLEERVDQERGRAGQVIGAFEDVATAISIQAKLVSSVMMDVQTAGMMLQPVRRDVDETRAR